jgi:AbrB family looped-hinge helix DNA binding protein
MSETEAHIMPLARVSSKGQITLPAATRRKLGITPNSQVELVERDNEVVIRRAKSISDLYGIFREAARGLEHLTWEEQRTIAEEAVAREVLGHE